MTDHDEQEKESPGRWMVALSQEEIAKNFAEIRPPVSEEEAIKEARRCLYCEYDVPCVRGCPAKIDIPRFIRQIADERPREAAKTIFDSNILGGVCARVCPVEKLCEALCVCRTLHGKPISIGVLQRYATDSLMKTGELPYTRGKPTGKRIAITGAGPAGIAAAFELARLGNEIDIFEREQELGGLDRYGIAEYKINAPFVRDELDYLMQIGGIRVVPERKSVGAEQLTRLLAEYDAVLLGIGLGTTRRLGVPGENMGGVVDAMNFIRQIKTRPLYTIPVGRRVIVIGAGNTAIDAATQARRLGAQKVIIAYRRGRPNAKCTDHEYNLSVSDGCEWMWNVEPVEVIGRDGYVEAVRFRGREPGIDREFEIECDHLIKAIGQEPHWWLHDVPGLELESNHTVKTDPVTWMTSVPGLFAAGDCVKRAKEVVNAVYEGKRAAQSINGWVSSKIV